VSIPGHFTSYVPVASSFVRPEGLGGRVMAPTVQAAAGDVNNCRDALKTVRSAVDSMN